MSLARLGPANPERSSHGLASLPGIHPARSTSRNKSLRKSKDGSKLSRELNSQKSSERRLKARLREVLQLQALGQQAGPARQALAAEYGAAKQAGIQINPTLDQAIQKVLGKKAAAQAAKGANASPVGGLLQGLKGNFGGGGGGGLGGLGGGGGGGFGGGNLGTTNLNGGNGFGGGGGRAHPPKPMSEQDHQTLADAIQQKGGFGDLIGGWRQTREGNCASVATIKAAMKEYGSDVFKDVQRSENGYQVQLKDGRTVNLSNEEFALARGQAQFAGNDAKALSYAELCYGVIAKNHADKHGASLMSSCFDLNNGFDPRQAARLLGLSQQMVPFNGQNGAVWNNSHAVFKDGYYDLWGRASNGFGGHSAFSLAPESLPKMPSAQWNVTGQADNPGADNPQADGGVEPPATDGGVSAPQPVSETPPATNEPPPSSN